MGEPTRLRRRDLLALALLGLPLLVSAVLVMRTELARDWRSHQRDFRALVATRLGPEKAELVPRGLQQIWVPSLRRADRCTSCHQGVLWRGLEDAEEPHRTHPPDPLEAHPIERFGCTSCHGGQGWAVDLAGAHGQVAYWDEPLLGAEAAERYSLEKNALIQMHCNVCHRYDEETEGADLVNEAKLLVQDFRCRACHTINGRGGTIGPDLSHVGDKPAEEYDFEHVQGPKTQLAWLTEHFQNPPVVVPNTVMPELGFTELETRALAILVMSWRRAPVPAEFLAGAPRADERTPTEAAEAENARQAMEGPGAWFVKTGCHICHPITVWNIESPVRIGPDLSIAIIESPVRYKGKTVEEFLDAPEKLMISVLGRALPLTPEQKATAVEKLHEAYEEYERQKAASEAAGG